MAENKIKYATYFLVVAALVVILTIMAENLFLTATIIPNIFLVMLILTFLYDVVYFVEYIDAPRTYLDLFFDILLAISLIAIAKMVYIESFIPWVFVVLIAAFVIAILKYIISFKRTKDKKAIKFIKRKGIFDALMIPLFIASTIVAYLYPNTGKYILLATAAGIALFGIYTTIKKDYFDI